MLSLQAIEMALTVITILFALCGLWVCVGAWWILTSGEIDEYRRVYREWMLRKWAEEDSYNKTYTNPDTEQITFNREKGRN